MCSLGKYPCRSDLCFRLYFLSIYSNLRLRGGGGQPKGGNVSKNGGRGDGKGVKVKVRRVVSFLPSVSRKTLSGIGRNSRH